MLKSDASALNSVPLSSNTVQRRVNEMSDDIQCPLHSCLHKCKLTILLDESTVHHGQALLIAYVQYVQDGGFKEEMLFCEEQKTTTTATDVYDLYK